MKESYN